ncbi:MAG: hypothetical protein KJO22_01415 [Bacteroidia bacterium]|nr:hypothetical protein [Bacteroidia bacterium]
MNNITKNFFTAIAVLLTCQVFAQQSNSATTEKTITYDDIAIVLGDWTGSLTYIDYSSNEPYTMPADVTVKQGKNKTKVSLNFKYPNEPNANSQGKISISKKGDKMNNETIVSKRILSNEQLEIITEYKGKDNKKKALIKNTYILGSKQFVIRKEVKFENSNEWMMRNEYSFKR